MLGKWTQKVRSNFNNSLKSRFDHVDYIYGLLSNDLIHT